MQSFCTKSKIEVCILNSNEAHNRYESHTACGLRIFIGTIPPKLYTVHSDSTYQSCVLHVCFIKVNDGFVCVFPSPL